MKCVPSTHGAGACLLVFVFSCLSAVALQPEATTSSDEAALIRWLLQPERELGMTPFREVIHATSGFRMLPYQPDSSVDQRMVAAVGHAMNAIFRELKDPAHSLHEVGRINEVSGHIEKMLLQKLDATDGFQCSIPATADGRTISSGYPDMRFEDLESGRVFYLDPKVYRSGSEQSSFRTFYFEPKVETNKVNDDATHLIVALAHLGKVDGQWVFASWKLVDLYDFKVRLKAEFQASNRDMYQADAVILSMEETE